MRGGLLLCSRHAFALSICVAQLGLQPRQRVAQRAVLRAQLRTLAVDPLPLRHELRLRALRRRTRRLSLERATLCVFAGCPRLCDVQQRRDLLAERICADSVGRGCGRLRLRHDGSSSSMRVGRELRDRVAELRVQRGEVSLVRGLLRGLALMEFGAQQLAHRLDFEVQVGMRVGAQLGGWLRRGRKLRAIRPRSKPGLAHRAALLS
jgi:hypothetical protein